MPNGSEHIGASRRGSLMGRYPVRVVTVLASVITMMVGLTAQVIPPASAAITTGFLGRVVDSQGEPMVGAQVKFWRRLGERQLSDYTETKMVVTNQRGQFRASVRPGEYHVEVIPTRADMYERYYYATLVGALDRTTNARQDPDDGFFLYLDLGLSTGEHFELDSGEVIDTGTSQLRQGIMVRGRIECPGAQHQAGEVHVNSTFRSGGGWEWAINTHLDVTRGGDYVSETPLPSGRKIRLNYHLDKCGYGGRDWVGGYDAYYTLPASAPGRTVEVMTIDQPPVDPIINPRIVGKTRVGERVRFDLGQWPAGTRAVRRSWHVSGEWVRAGREHVRLRREWRGERIWGRMMWTAPGHFVGGMPTAKRRIR